MQGFASTTAVPPPPRPGGRVERPRHLQLAAALAALAWYFCARTLSASAANGLGTRFDLGLLRPVLEAAFQVFLVIVGIALLAGIERRRAPLRLTLGLPTRRTARTEWTEGAALGWALAVASVLPLVLTASVEVRFWTGSRAWTMALLNVLVLGMLTLAHTLGVFGYAFHRLIDAAGPVRATLVLSLLAGLASALNPNAGGSTAIRATIAFAAAVLLCLCWLRTHGLWIGWGLHFAWAAATAILFGLPLAGSVAYSSLVDARPYGPLWLTGGDFGPGAAFSTLVFELGATVVLIRITGDYAWNYTHAPIIPGGYEVDVPPPAAHTALETAPPPPPSLVQILPAASAGPAAPPSSE